MGAAGDSSEAVPHVGHGQQRLKQNSAPSFIFSPTSESVPG